MLVRTAVTLKFYAGPGPKSMHVHHRDFKIWVEVPLV